MKHLLMILTAITLLSGCESQTDQPDSRKVRIAIRTPDGLFYNLESNPSLLSSTGSRFHDAVLTESEMSKLIDIVRKEHSLAWEEMTAESPYPDTHVVLLWYSSGSNQMCSIGSKEKAMPLLQEIGAYIPDPEKQEYLNSLK